MNYYEIRNNLFKDYEEASHEYLDTIAVLLRLKLHEIKEQYLDVDIYHYIMKVPSINMKELKYDKNNSPINLKEVLESKKINLAEEKVKKVLEKEGGLYQCSVKIVYNNLHIFFPNEIEDGRLICNLK